MFFTYTLSHTDPKDKGIWEPRDTGEMDVILVPQFQCLSFVIFTWLTSERATRGKGIYLFSICRSTYNLALDVLPFVFFHSDLSDKFNTFPHYDKGMSSLRHWCIPGVCVFHLIRIFSFTPLTENFKVISSFVWFSLRKIWMWPLHCLSPLFHLDLSDGVVIRPEEFVPNLNLVGHVPLHLEWVVEGGKLFQVASN